jgi:hypothetical protein
VPDSKAFIATKLGERYSYITIRRKFPANITTNSKKTIKMLRGHLRRVISTIASKVVFGLFSLHDIPSRATTATDLDLHLM